MCIYGNKVETFSQGRGLAVYMVLTWLHVGKHQSVCEITDFLKSCFDSVGSHEH